LVENSPLRLWHLARPAVVMCERMHRSYSFLGKASSYYR
jgi:hypothetical protein